MLSPVILLGEDGDEQHRCMGLNSHGVSKVIDAAGVKQVEQ